MPTFNQLVHTGREVHEKKAKASALLKGWNSKKRVAINQIPHKSAVFVLLLRLQLLRTKLRAQKDCESSSFQWN